MTSKDYNYIQTLFPCSFTIFGAHDIYNHDPLLDALQDNGGATQTRALFIGSPAIDQIPSALCRDSFGTAPVPDQRGVARPVNGLCDIGAYEGSIALLQYNRNSIRNGAAENGAGSPTGAYIGTPNWVVTAGQFTAVPYDSPGGFPTAAQGLANHSYNFFAGGNAALSQANQTINVSSISTDINAGRVKYTLSADLGGYANQDDSATLTISFLDQFSMQLGSPVTIGPVLAAERGSVTGFRNKSAGGSVPATTQTIKVEVAMTRGGIGGTYNDGYADNLSLVLSPPLYLPLILR